MAAEGGPWQLLIRLGGRAAEAKPQTPKLSRMTKLRIRDAAEFLGVSDDTVRRWVDSGQLSHELDQSNRKVIDGGVLAEFAQSVANPMQDPSDVARSARNRFVGLVSRVVSDTVMSQVELQCGPFRVVSLMSTEAVDELGLRPGVVAVAVVKATTVIVEVPGESSARGERRH